jgi:anthraniloyl-CoA monooxygenase
LPYIAGTSQVPREMTRADMDRVKADFVAATRRAASADFDMVEFHAAHGYLMSSFISPLTNRRSDEYGGSLENRCRYPLEVFKAMREAWPADKPMSVRISAHDWVAGGITPDDATQVAKLFQDAGADIIHVSSGQVSKEEAPVYGRMFQVPFSDQIRNELDVPTITVGNIFEADHVNTIIAAGAPTFARWPARTWPIRPGRCTRRRSRAYKDMSVAEAVPGRQGPSSNATWSARRSSR